MQMTQDQLTSYDVNREFLLEEIERFLAGKISEEDLFYAIKIVKPAKEEEESC